MIDNRVGIWSWSETRFHSKYTQNPVTACWEWNGAANKFGPLYGVYKNDHAQMTQATRVAFMQTHQEPIEDSYIKTTCKNRNCVNPDHLKRVIKPLP